jgi:hypothetical protein
VEKTIGPAGGTLASTDELLTIEVPAGALDADTQLGIQPLTSTAPNGLGSGFRLTPAGVTFSSPVTLTFNPTTEQLAGTVIALTGIGYQDSSGVWRWMRSVERDEANGLVSVTTTHFSDWSLLAGAQLRPPKASVKTGETLTLTAVECWTEEEELAPLPGEEQLAPLPPRFDCDPEGEQLAPLPLKLSNWSVNGIAGGNGTIGTVSAHGVAATYGAPSTKPDPSTVAVSVEASNVKLDGRTFPKTILVSNITIAGEKETYRGTFDLSWQEQSESEGWTTTFNASGTVEFGSPYRNPADTHFSLISDNSTAQITNYRFVECGEGCDLVGPNICTAAGPIDVPLLAGYLVILTSSLSSYGVSISVGSDFTAMCSGGPGWGEGGPISVSPWASVGDRDFGGECMGTKSFPLPPDGGNLSGSASWTCTDSTTITATLTWSLTGS